MVLCIPVVDGHDLTIALLESLAESVTGSNFEVVIFDNASEESYEYMSKMKWPFPVHIFEYYKNIGFYAPLEIVAEQYDEAKLIGLIHNDMVIYERGWNERMEQAFLNDSKLALVGLCGSSEIDNLGGRGAGTVCYFKGGEVTVGDRVIRGQTQDAGRRTNELVPSACLDSLFMMFRAHAIQDLVTEADPWKDITLAHFYDRIWPVRLIENGWHVATMGVECDHLGGMTTTGSIRYRDDCISWFDERGMAFDNPETEMYLVAERRYLGEYRDTKHFIPCRIDNGYNYKKS